MASIRPMNKSGEVQIGEHCEKLSPIYAVWRRDANLSPLSAAPRFECVTGLIRGPMLATSKLKIEYGKS
jgi:hypothetical protein